MRQSSDRPASNGGWWHDVAGELPTSTGTPRPKLPPEAVGELHRQYRDDLRVGHLDHAATSLGVSADALDRLGCGVLLADRVTDGPALPPVRALAFPMLDADGRVVGIRFRGWPRRAGDKPGKWSLLGGSNGPCVPAGLPERPDVLVVAEGPTDAAAPLSIDLAALAVPDCRGGGRASLAALLATVTRLRPRRVLVLADRDGPGWTGATSTGRTIATTCGVPVRVACVPEPHNDARDWHRSGATADDVLALLAIGGAA